VLLEHPTRGLDIESVIYIWSKLKERCQLGTAIIFISSDLDEILQYSDRVLVFFAGKVSPPFQAEKLNIEQLGQLIGGKGWSSFTPSTLGELPTAGPAGLVRAENPAAEISERADNV
jgi:ABC-type multidrug transport system ATPase subunit